MNEEFNKWEHFRVIKKFTLLPLRIYQYTSHKIWWSWLKTTYVFQTRCYPPHETYSLMKILHGYLFGYWWKNERISREEEYNDYLNRK